MGRQRAGHRAHGHVAFGDWNNPTPFSAMPGCAPGASEVSFDIPVPDPTTNAGATSLQFVNHAWTRDQFRDLLRIRKSSTPLRLRTAADIRQRLKSWNTGSAQVPTVIAGDVDGSGYAGANFQELTYFINVDKQAHPITIPALAARSFVLHPVHLAAGAADARAAQASYDGANGTFTIPARTAVVFVVR